MRYPQILPVLTSMVMCLHFCGQAQNILSKRTILFNNGQSKINATDATGLKTFLQDLKADSAIQILVEGNADNIGRYAINKLLAKKRALSVKDDLIKAGIREDHIRVLSWGPDKPVGDNRTKKGRQQNRRVDISFTRPDDPTPAKAEIEDLTELTRQLMTPAQRFCINRFRDTVIRCSKGTVICIRANSFISASDCGGNNCISFNIKEDFLKSDMILDDLSTTSDGEIIETQGMIHTEAFDCMGNRLRLQTGKDLIILIPTDSIIPGAKVFDGNRTHDSIMNWTVSNNPVLSNFTLAQLDLCSRIICVVGKTNTCKKCRFFFCRIGRVGKTAKSIFSKEQREENEAFRQCQLDLDTEKNALIDSSLLPKCGTLKALFKKYGVNDADGLIRAINKPLMDSFKVTTLDQLKDTLAKITTRKIELSYMNRNISFDDFNYYVYNSSKLGWNNIDCFSGYSKWEKTTVRVNGKAHKNTSCKLIFKDRRAIMPATKEGGQFEFVGVPLDVRATVVAIKYENGRPYFGMKEIVVSDKPIDIDWQLLTLDQLKQELKKLDQ